jgi:hypothetical protein
MEYAKVVMFMIWSMAGPPRAIRGKGRFREIRESRGGISWAKPLPK